MNSDPLFLRCLGRAFAHCRKNSLKSLLYLSFNCELPILFIDRFENGNTDIEMDDLANLLVHIKSSFSDLFERYEVERVKELRP